MKRSWPTIEDMLATQAVHLLLFSERGLSFGVSAEQVKELLNAAPPAADGHRRLERTVAYKGRELQVVQLSRRLKLQEALENDRDFLRCRNLPPEKKDGSVEREDAVGPEPSSRILVVQHRSEGVLGVHVECLQQLRLVPLTQILRLPLIMERKKQLQSVWGLALIDRQPVVLVDLEHI